MVSPPLSGVWASVMGSCRGDILRTRRGSGKESGRPHIYAGLAEAALPRGDKAVPKMCSTIAVPC